MNDGMGSFDADPRIPSPERELGVGIGTRPLHHDEVLRYSERLSSSSARVALTTYGATAEGRPLVHLTISSEANIARLDEISAQTRQLGNGRRRQEKTRAPEIPASVWIGCSIHGDELSGVDAGIALAHRLAAGRDVLAGRIRDRLVVHIDPSVNPDGRVRSLAQVAAFSGRLADTETTGIAHRLRWPRGRGNHYLFDLNRDLVPQVQLETRARTATFLHLLPQLVIELHEMGPDDTFLFASPGAPLNPYLPAHAARWWQRLSRAGAAALVERGKSSYRGEWNEVFYPGYMDIWPAYNGAVAVIFEQPSTLGSPIRQRSGRLLTFLDAVSHQYTALVAYLGAASEQSDSLLGDWASARRNAARGRAGRTEIGYQLSSAMESRLDWLVRTLINHGIEVHADSVQPGNYFVRLDQPAAPLVRNLLDKEVPLSADFLKTERTTIEATGSATLYDVTAWSLPVVAGVDAHVMREIPNGDWVSVDAVPDRPGGAHGQATFGWLFADDAFRLTAPLLRLGARLHVAVAPFTIEGTEYPRGTFLMVRGENPESILADLDEFARAAGVVANGIDGPLAEAGPDLGGHRFPLLLPPRVGVVCGDGVEPTSYGAIWHALDMAGTPMSGLDIGQLRGEDLARYTVLILPETNDDPNGYRAMGPDLLDRLRAWTASGGTLIGIAGGSRFLASESIGLSRARMQTDEEAARFMPRGTLVWAEAATHHWLTAGAESRVAVMFRSPQVLDSPPDAEVAVRFGASGGLHASGLLWPEAEEQIAGTPFLTRESIGAGQVILFSVDPVFRGLTLSTARLFMNAVHLGQGLGTSVHRASVWPSGR